MQKLIFAFIACSFFGQQINAQKKVYSLEQIWQKTLKQYPTLEEKKYQIRALELETALVEKKRLPEVNFQAQQSTGSYQGTAASFFPLPGNFNTAAVRPLSIDQANTHHNIYSSALMQWDFLQFGKINAEVKMTQYALERGKNALSQEALMLQVAAARQYFAVLYASASLATAKAEVQRLQELFELSAAQAQAGLQPGADTLLVKSNYLQLRGNIHEQEALLQTGMLELSAMIGEESQPFLIDSAFYNRHTEHVTDPADTNLINHPYLKFLISDIQFQQAKLEVLKKQSLPTAGLLAGVGIKGSGPENSGKGNFLDPWQNPSGSYLVGIGVTWKLSSFYENKVRQRIVEKQMEASRAGFEAGKLQLTTRHQTALQRWLLQAKKLSDAQLALITAREAYELYVTRYETGLINLIELLQLQKSLQDAESNFNNARNAYWNELIQQAESSGNTDWLLSLIN